MLSGVTASLVSWGRGTPSTLDLTAASLSILASIMGYYLLNNLELYEDRTKLQGEVESSVAPILVGLGLMGLVFFLAADAGNKIDPQPSIAGMVAGFSLAMALGPRWVKVEGGSGVDGHPSSGGAGGGRKVGFKDQRTVNSRSAVCIFFGMQLAALQVFLDAVALQHAVK